MAHAPSPASPNGHAVYAALGGTGRSCQNHHVLFRQAISFPLIMQARHCRGGGCRRIASRGGLRACQGLGAYSRKQR